MSLALERRLAAVIVVAMAILALAIPPARGQSGATGATGTSGTTGTTGATGASGAAGSTAPTGPAGSTGASGAAGGTAPWAPGPLPRSGFALDVTGGGQVVVDDEDNAMFLKYQDVQEPLVLPHLDLRVRAWDTDFHLTAVDAAEQDAIYRFDVQRPGTFMVSLGWDELPHRMSEETTTLYSLSGGDRLLIPDKIQQTLQGQSFRLDEFLRQHAHPVTLETSRKTSRASASFSPYRGLLLFVSDEKEQRDGSTQRSISTNFANGADIDEFANPIDYETHRTSFGLELREGPFWVNASAGFIRFDNGADRLLVDNPLRLQDSLGVTFGNRSAKTFLVTTPQDNEAYDYSLEAGVALPLNMRITGTYASGHVDAETRMRDYTSNSAAKANPFYPDLPSSTIDAQVDTSRYDLAFTGTPLKWLSFRVFARGYEFDNQTPVYTFPIYVQADTAFETVTRRALPYAWKRNGEGIDLRVRILPSLSVGAGYQWESVERTYREVADSDEDILRVNVDYSLLGRLTLHGDGEWSDRTADDYDPKAYFQSFPLGVPPAQLRLPELKRFDVASRERQGYGVSGGYDFGHGWGLDAESRQRKDDYVDSDYGLVDQDWRNQLFGLTMKINEPCEVRAENGNEFMTLRVNDRYRPLLAGRPVDARANDWSDEITSKVHTVSGGLSCRDAENDHWDFRAWIDYAQDRQSDDAAFTSHAVVDPNFLAHARDHAPIERTIQRYTGNVRFDLARHWSMVVAGYFEKFVEDDPTQDLMIPTMGRADTQAFESAYLGVHWESYSVRVFSLLLNAHW